jgi:hypothetical protein
MKQGKTMKKEALPWPSIKQRTMAADEALGGFTP